MGGGGAPPAWHRPPPRGVPVATARAGRAARPGRHARRGRPLQRRPGAGPTRPGGRGGAAPAARRRAAARHGDEPVRCGPRPHHRDDVARVNARVTELLGPLGTVEHCPHGPDDGCTCRKPGPGLVVRAAQTLAVAPHECVVVGDVGSDVEAARAAGAHAVLVPTPVTRAEEVERADHVAPDLAAAVDHVLTLAGRAR
ncbi:MAG TPA: HAD-IIIA family hydrolase [Actinomycetaceae bacterium]|nr:HAD-IIIA family hydrolase [Actinomycetaceae bacterium]